MSKSTESKPITSSVIARLMGLDELQAQQPVNKQKKLQRVLSENYLRKVALIGAWEKRSFDERSVEEKKEFKDEFEVKETLVIGKVSDSFAAKERERSGFVDSRQGCFEICFEKPDYLITNHSYDQESPKLLQNLENGFVKDSRRKYRHDSTSIVPRFQLESNNAGSPPSRKMVILKPKPGETETDEKDKGFLGHGKGNSHAQVKERKNFSDCVKSKAHGSVPSSATEKGITRKTRDSISDSSFEPPRLGFSGAQGLTKEPEFMMVSSRNNADMKDWYNPSCYDLDGPYMAKEAKQQIMESWRMTKEFRENGHAFGGRSRSRTLGEMLALPDHAKRANSRGPFGISSRDGWKNGGIGDLLKLRSQSYSTPVGSPITKATPKAFHVDSYTSTRPVFPWSRRKDCPKQRNSGSNCKLSHSSPGLEAEKSHRSQSGPDLEAENSNLLEEKSKVSMSFEHDIVHSNSENEITPVDEIIIVDQWNDIKDRKVSTEDCVVPKSSMYPAASRSIVSDMVVAVETPDAAKSTGNHNQHQIESINCTMSEKDHVSSFCIPDAWSQQEDISMKISEECGTDPDFLVTLETANQPSPVSVLEAPFVEENSLSSKCFFSVTASLNDVKRQLEFLKSESIEEYSEGPGMVVSSDDENDVVEEPLKGEVNEYSTKLFGAAESRDFSYSVDVLTEAGFHSRNPDILFNGWNSPATPISLSVFETLEKKYGEQISWKRSERRLLFDRINSGLMEILQPCLGDPMWAKPVARRLSYSQNSKEIEEELYKLLVSQENESKNEAKKDSSAKVFGKEDGWLSLGYDIEAIGREIENSLIDELAAEIVSL
ncbi:hypothetical protein HRI_001735800 [Hibiscus trionum]|uniref:DUF4378 domain-containing protein n=1 Tax=Hibiscus trionum TaxID=183268 RepID=A0A9W7HRK4_HIBTR|nr:hypothetical protein HRI_001735800 [Hibiscus trionum]